MRGYAVKEGSDATVVYNNGVLNSGTYSASITQTYGATNEGFNLLCNPYPSAIDWDAASGWTKTNIESNTIWFRTNSQYATYNGNTASFPSRNYEYYTCTSGFLVRVSYDKSDGSLEMNNAARIHDGLSIYRLNANAKSTDLQYIRIKTTGSGRRMKWPFV